ncbi:hypothetical protein, partial [Xanthomonas oryzae]|uniref:hypothetical protein n=1 Tax=Xanthomonas oryzae TaxID=347 RepID=UPI001C0D78FA
MSAEPWAYRRQLPRPPQHATSGVHRPLHESFQTSGRRTLALHELCPALTRTVVRSAINIRPIHLCDALPRRTQFLTNPRAKKKAGFHRPSRSRGTAAEAAVLQALLDDL